MWRECRSVLWAGASVTHHPGDQGLPQGLGWSGTVSLAQAHTWVLELVLVQQAFAQSVAVLRHPRDRSQCF